MKNTVIKFGGYGLITATSLFVLVLWLGTTMSYSAQEVLGYATMLAALSFIYFGIKHFRDKVNGGLVSFTKALIIGILISVFVGIGIAIADFIYTAIINPNFMVEYMDYTLKGMEETLSASEFETQKVILENQMKAMGSPLMMAIIMFATVFIIGFVISLISSLILQRKN